MSPGEQRFETCHVSDVLNGLAIALNRLKLSVKGTNETYALLDGESYTLKALVELVVLAVNKPIDIKWGLRQYREREVMSVPYTSYDILPGWTKKVSLRLGLRWMIENEYSKEN
jgi:CDP-3, 6-dideoxy-D-glycero-L-glycero-4-hexulose-4-reductase